MNCPKNDKREILQPSDNKVISAHLKIRMYITLKN